MVHLSVKMHQEYFLVQKIINENINQGLNIFTSLKTLITSESKETEVVCKNISNRMLFKTTTKK